MCDAVKDAELRSEEKTSGNKLHLHRFYDRDEGSQVLVHIYYYLVLQYAMLDSEF